MSHLLCDPLVEPRRPVTVRVARWSATHPWRAIMIWTVFVAVCIGVGSSMSTKQVDDVDLASGQSHHALQLLRDAHLDTAATESVLVTARHGTLPAAAARAAASDAAQHLRRLPQVAHVDPVIASKDGQALLVQVRMTKHAGDDGDVQPLLDATAAAQRDHPALRAEQVGSVSLDKAVNDQVASDLATATNVSLPVTVIILLIAFGAIVAAGVPVLLALSAVGAATGLSTLVSHVVPDSGTTSSMILLMGMAVGVDYSLFYVKRVRAERRAGRTTHAAIDIAAETSGHSVIVSGTAVIVSMVGLFLARDAVFSSLAVGSIIVVAVAVLGSLTVLPALLVKLGRAVERPRVPVLWRLTAQTREPRFWPRLLRPALQHPARTLVVAVLALLALAAPMTHLRLHSDSAASLPSSIAETHSLHRLNAAFPDQNTSLTVVVSAPAAEAAQVSARLHTLATDASRDPLYTPSTDGGRLQASADGTVHRVDLAVPHDAESGAARDALDALRSRLLPDALRGVPHADWAVAGDTADAVDTDDHLRDALPVVIGFVVLLTMLVMGWVFRSALIAISTAVINLLSAGAAFGVLVLTFQTTWAEHVLGFHSTGAVVNWIPLFTFAVLFGLSMDYHVFVLGHIREAAASGLPTREAVRAGITRSAGTVTSAAFVMVSVFAIFASLHMVEMKELGFTLAVAVLIDALVVRGVVLPALLVLLGRAAWWPGRHPGGGGRRAWRPAGAAIGAGPSPEPVRELVSPR